MISAVVDSNVLVSGIGAVRVATSAPGELLRRWAAGEFEIVSSEPILVEVARAFEKPYFRRRLSQEQIDRAVAALRRQARFVVLSRHVTDVAPHPADDLVLSTALSAGVPYLVTGDVEFRRLGTYESVTVLTPREFLGVLGGARPEAGQP